MAKLFQFSIFCILQLYSLSLSIPSLHANHLCAHDQSLSLLNFKETLQIYTDSWVTCIGEFGLYESSYINPYCSNFHPIVSKISSWNSSTDCCSWEGVTCDQFTGNVVELDLSFSRLSGEINSNSTIFQLSHLQRLNLAYNFLEYKIAPEFRRFTHLSHLNLSGYHFQDQIPSEISLLDELVSLDLSVDLSYDDYVYIKQPFLEPHVFKVLLQNMSKLRELNLKGVAIGSSFPNNMSTSLTILDLSSTNLEGAFPYHIFDLPNLQQLSLGSNSFDGSGSLTGSIRNNSSPLWKLEIPGISIAKKLLDTIGNLNHLTYLDLSSCNLDGTLPQSFGNLTQLRHLNLSQNTFSGQIPQGILGLEHLTLLDMEGNNLDAPIPHSSSNNMRSLKVLSLPNNTLTATCVSSFLSNLTRLETLDLSYNPLYEMPRDLFELSSLQKIRLKYTHLHGPIPQLFSNLVNLISLDLSSNNFGCDLDVRFLNNFKWMDRLDLSFSNLSLTKESNTTLPVISINFLLLNKCNIRDLDVLRSIVVEDGLYLSNNNIHGEIPEWAWSNWSNISFVDLSHNFITHIGNKIPLQSLWGLSIGSNLLQGELPGLPPHIFILSLPNNQLHGEIKSSTCEQRMFSVLDLSNNSLTGTLPQCISNARVLDLHMNKLQGTIPDTFSDESESLNLRGNHFEGKIPISLKHASYLKFLDLSDNNLSDAFPIWLGYLFDLQYLSLRSNKLYGPIFSSDALGYEFFYIMILDISYNQLSGHFPPRLLNGFKQKTSLSSAYYDGIGFGNDDSTEWYYNSLTIVLNGNTVRLDKISVDMVIIDMSCNHFEGEIPSSIGGLIGIRQLNLSHNNFTGQIPPQLGNLINLQSLGLSHNQLEGNIPRQLADFKFISVLNLSYNHLTGQIPTGPQLQTMPNDSYIGNDGLCGLPLSRKCGHDNAPTHVEVPDEEDHQEFFDGFTWQSVMVGYGVGICIGFVIGTIMLFSEKPKWLIRVVKEEAQKINYKYKGRNGISWIIAS